MAMMKKFICYNPTHILIQIFFSFRFSSLFIIFLHYFTRLIHHHTHSLLRLSRLLLIFFYNSSHLIINLYSMSFYCSHVIFLLRSHSFVRNITLLPIRQLLLLLLLLLPRLESLPMSTIVALWAWCS